MITEPTEAIVEKFARALILGFKGDPDMMVQPGTPQVYGTPSGDVFAATPGAQVPLWRMYKGTARQMIEMAIAMLSEAAPQPVTAATNIEQISAELSHLGVDQPKVA